MIDMERISLDDIPADLLALMRTQVSMCDDWHEGEPIELFQCNGLPCIRYESGQWWHYDIERREWF